MTATFWGTAPKSDLEYGACDNLMDGFSFSARDCPNPNRPPPSVIRARKLDFLAAVSNYQQKIGPSSTMGLGSLPCFIVSRLAS